MQLRGSNTLLFFALSSATRICSWVTKDCVMLCLQEALRAAQRAKQLKSNPTNWIVPLLNRARDRKCVMLCPCRGAGSLLFRE